MDRGDPLKKEMTTHSSVLAWEIPWTEEPGGLQSGTAKESDNLVNKQQQYTHTHTHTHIFFIHSSVNRHLDCLHVLSIVNSATSNIRVHVSF